MFPLGRREAPVRDGIRKREWTRRQDLTLDMTPRHPQRSELCFPAPCFWGIGAIATRYWNGSAHRFTVLKDRLLAGVTRWRNGTAANETKHMVMVVDNGASMNLALNAARIHAGFNIEAARRNRFHRQGKASA